MNLWLKQHIQACKQVLARFLSNSLSTLLIALAIGVTLALPVVLYTVLDSLNGLVSEVKKESHISMFLKKDIGDATVESIHNELDKNAEIKSVLYVPKDEALKQLAESNANEDVINSLEENPLPDAFFIEPKSLDAVAVDRLKYALSQIDGVEEVIVDGAWIKRLNYLLSLGKKAMLMLAALLGFALFIVIGNTLRMQILTQRAEIELSQLIGATKSFIRRPFLYSGALYGLFGGLLALVIACAVIYAFNQSIALLAAEYKSNFSLHFPNVTSAVATCLLSVSIGLISAYLAVSKLLFKSIN
ncbi:MAG: permease-like cell division protein FtsX [Methylophilaceae bacterium]